MMSGLAIMQPYLKVLPLDRVRSYNRVQWFCEMFHQVLLFREILPRLNNANMHKLAQNIIVDDDGHKSIEHDWFPAPLPGNINLEEMSYPDTSYSFATFFSEKPVGFTLGYASGNYGHCLFNTGSKGEIKIGKFVALQCTRFICNYRIELHDHCMVSWGAVITDSWIIDDTITPAMKRSMLENASK